VSACARVTRLSVTPVKGLALHHPDEVVLLRTGAAGDREFFVIDDRDRLISIWKTGRLVKFCAAHDTGSGRITLSSAEGEVCDGPARLGAPVAADFYGRRKVPGTVVEGPWNAALSEAAGEPVRLVRASDPSAGHDEYPVTLLGEDSVAELARRSGAGSVDPRRFRMLISFSGPSAHAEDSWQGQTVEIGEAAVRVGGPVPRCAATTRDPDRGARDLPTVRMIRSYRGVQANEFGRGVNFGIYAEVVTEGIVRVGDPLSVRPAGSQRDL
jgi:MOSC domain-containing protein